MKRMSLPMPPEAVVARSPARPADRQDGHRIGGRHLALATLIGVAVLTFALRAYALDRSWEVFVDEITYLRLSESAGGTGKVILYGKPFHLHPPAFFYLEGLYLRLIPEGVDTITRVERARYLNVWLATASAVTLLAIGRTVLGTRAGLTAALIFALEPFIIRMNSRNTIETAAILFVLLGYWLLIRAAARAHGPPARWSAVPAGVAFGLGILTKDTIACLTVAPLLVIALTGWDIGRRAAMEAIVAAVGCYLLYLLLIVAVGQADEFAAQKLRGLARFVGLVKETGFKREGGPSFISALLANIHALGTTYILLGLGALAALMLLFLPLRFGRVLALWALGAYASIGYSLLFGTLEEQFFYFVIVPAELVVAVVGWVLAGRTDRAGRLLVRLGPVAAVIYLAWCVSAWVPIHTTPDNGFERLLASMRAQVPAGSKVSVTTDTAEFLMDGYDSGSWVTVEQLREQRVRYLLLSTRQIEEGYSDATPELRDWALHTGERIFAFTSRSNGTLELYRLPPEY